MQVWLRAQTSGTSTSYVQPRSGVPRCLLIRETDSFEQHSYTSNKYANHACCLLLLSFRYWRAYYDVVTNTVQSVTGLLDKVRHNTVRHRPFPV
jgi:hypothetical protein